MKRSAAITIAAILAVAAPVFADGSAAPAATVIAPDTGSGSSPAVTPAPAATPASALPNPVDDPVKAIETLKAQKSQGWAAAILAGLVMFTAGFSRATKRWPDSKLFAWFAKNKTAVFAVSALSLTAAAAFNAIALGGTWMAAAYAGAGAFFLVIHPGTADTTKGA